MSEYLERVKKWVEDRNATEPEFVQAVDELLSSLEPVIDKHPEYEKHGILERMVEPDRLLEFRVAWVDDEGNTQVNRGYRVQFNGALGPYKGGLRLHPSVTASVVKFLGFEQTYKNALTGLAMGGGKGGSDFDPRGRSDNEIMRFCQAFMTELYRYIGPSTDVPAGDIGVGDREIGYLFGQYKRIVGAYENGVLTGKNRLFGGSVIRPEATGFGAGYFVREIFNHLDEEFANKTFAVSGFGNVAWGTCQKITELGGKVVTLSGPDGYIYDEEGVNTREKFDYMLEMRNSGRDKVKDYADKFDVPFYEGKKPWEVKVDVCMPCATQNEVDVDDVKQMLDNGVKYYIEVSNMPTTAEAMAYLHEHAGDLVMAPSKAVNAGGVAVSGLEMAQNSSKISWEPERVDAELDRIMVNIHAAAQEAAEKYDLGYDLMAGANIAGFNKVAEAMIREGVM